MNEKQLLIENVTAAMPVAEQLMTVEKEIADLQSILNKKKPKKKAISIIGFFISYFIFAFKVSVFLTYFVMIYAFFYSLSGFTMSDFGLLIEFIILLAIYSFVIFKFYLNPILRKSNAKKRIPELQQKCAELAQDNSLSWLPATYRTGSCINAIYNYVMNSRADSLKEALNLLEIEMHHNRMEDAAMQGAYTAVIDSL